MTSSMARRLLACLVAALLVPIVASTEVRATNVPAPIPHGRALALLAGEESVLVGLSGGSSGDALLRDAGGELVSASLRVWRVAGGAAPWLVPELERRGLLRYAEADRERARQGHLDRGDPLLPLAWHLERTAADRAEPPGPGVPITIVDTGLDLTHPEFAARPDVVALNAQHVPATLTADGYHGTRVASIAGAPADGTGLVGVYPEALLRSYDLPSLADSAIIKGIEAAVAAGPGVINLSLGGPGYSRALYEATLQAVNSGSLVVAAAGNDFLEGDPAIYPADYPHVLTVAATDRFDKPAVFSSSSPAVDLAAPGIDIPVQDPDLASSYALFSGTSYAAPVAAGAAAWVWSTRPDLDATQIAELLRQSARDTGVTGFDVRTGFGLVQIPAALAAPAPAPDPLEPNDDIELVRARAVFASAKPALTAVDRPRAVLDGRLDRAEDPADVYRIFVPAGRRLTVTVVPDGPLFAALWKPRTRTVMAGGRTARRNRLALSRKPGSGVERLRWRNVGTRSKTVFLEIALPRGSSSPLRTAYTLDVVIA